MGKELDRKTRPWFYLISFSMMIAGFVFHFNAWLIGGGLLIFMLIIFEDAKDEERTKEVKHESRDRGTDESSKDQMPRM